MTSGVPYGLKAILAVACTRFISFMVIYLAIFCCRCSTFFQVIVIAYQMIVLFIQHLLHWNSRIGIGIE